MINYKVKIMWDIFVIMIRFQKKIQVAKLEFELFEI